MSIKPEKLVVARSLAKELNEIMLDDCCTFPRLVHAHAHLASTIIERLCLEIELLEAAQPKWISVEERLPEQEGMYIVYIERNKGNAFIGTDHYDFLNHWGGEGWYDGRYVTHWMPFDSLPEPPKEGV